MQVLTSGEARPLEDADDPVALFEQWLLEAGTCELNDPNAMALATAGSDGLPDVRMVLLKGFDTDGFVFFTNTRSQKGDQLRDNMQAAAVLHWKSLGRQVRFRGPVEFVSDAEADIYFASRPRDSRIGAWASQQSCPLGDRLTLEKAVAQVATRFPFGHVPRPPHWTGYRIRPISLEFWTNMPFRLHDRLVFKRERPEGDWTKGRLYP